MDRTVRMKVGTRVVHKGTRAWGTVTAKYAGRTIEVEFDHGMVSTNLDPATFRTEDEELRNLEDRRASIVRKLKQLKADTDFWNENERPSGVDPIVIDLNFQKDLDAIDQAHEAVLARERRDAAK